MSAGDVEALARVLHSAAVCDDPYCMTPHANQRREAQRILACDWLAADRARVRAEVLAEAAGAARNYPSDLDLGDAPSRGEWWIRQAVGAWLEGMAEVSRMREHDEWCPANGCRCGKCECAQMPGCGKEAPDAEH